MGESKETGAWRYLAAGAIFGWLAGHMLVTGELPVDKHKTMIVTRASDPVIYWSVLIVSAVIALLCLRKLWKRFTDS